MADFPNVNGHEYSWASVTIKVTIPGLGVKKYNKVMSCTYGDGNEPGLIDVNASVPAGWTRGKWQGDDVQIEMPMSEAQTFIDDLGDDYGAKVLQIMVAWADTGMPTITHELPACRITKVADAPGGGGNEPAKTTITMKMLKPIKRNGKQIVATPVAAL